LSRPRWRHGASSPGRNADQVTWVANPIAISAHPGVHATVSLEGRDQAVEFGDLGARSRCRHGAAGIAYENAKTLSRRDYALPMFRRPRPQPIARLSLRDVDPDHEVERLHRMLDDINEVIELLWLEVEDLRAQLGRLRGGDVPAMYARPPTQSAPPTTESVSVLARQVDDASIAADALWFESQWIRSQVSSIVEM
jgi:hypothetical protein